MWRVITLVLAGFAIGCSKEPTNNSSNDLQGLADLFGANYPTPKTRSASELSALKKKIFISLNSQSRPYLVSNSPQNQLSRTLLEGIKAQGGIPRWQLRQILKSFLTSENTACGGATCARVLDLNVQTVDTFLDSLYKDVQKTARPYSTDLQKVRETILGSLKRDYDLPTEAKGNELVKFQHFSFRPSTLPESAGQTLTYDQIDKIHKLTLQLPAKVDEDVKDNFSDLLKYRGLNSLTIITNNGNMIRQIAPFADQVRHLEIENLGFYSYLKVDDLAPFTTLPYLKSLKITGMKIEHIGLPREFLPQLKSLTISNPGSPISDDTIRQLGTFPSLQSIHFESIPLENFSRLNEPLPSRIHESSFAPLTMSDKTTAQYAKACQNLTGLRYFSNVRSMSLKGCIVSNFDTIPFPVKWEILNIDRCHSAHSTTTQLRVNGQFANLLVINIEKSHGLELDSVTRNDLTVKLALKKSSERSSAP